MSMVCCMGFFNAGREAGLDSERGYYEEVLN